MILSHKQAAATSLLLGPGGILLGSFLWWTYAKSDCSIGSIAMECVTTAEGLETSWLGLAGPNSALLFGAALAVIALVVFEIAIWAQGPGRQPDS